MPDVLQVDSMSDDLRNTLWNALNRFYWSTDGYLFKRYGEPGISPFAQALWMNLFKRPVDTLPQHGSEMLKRIREHFFRCEWCEVYDFIEFMCGFYLEAHPRFPNIMNHYLERERSAYRFVGAQLTKIADQAELTALEEAVTDDRFAGVSLHLKRAAQLYSDRKNPDNRNSIKESISAVESMAKIIAANDKATLVDALRALERGGKLHTALKDGFIKLYAYTSDEDGIRHAMMQEPNLSEADARYFLLSCTSFVNYLKSQMNA